MQVTKSNSVNTQERGQMPQSKSKARKSSWLGKTISICAFIAAMAVSPMLEGRAGAEEQPLSPQPPPTPAAVCAREDTVQPLPCHIQEGADQERSCQIRACSRSGATITEGEETHAVFIINDQFAVPVVEVEGPAAVQLSFFPALLNTDFNEAGEAGIPEVSVFVQRNGDEPERFSFGRTCTRSDMTAADSEDQEVFPTSGEYAMSLANPLVVNVDAGEGTNTITIEMVEEEDLLPFGFLAISVIPISEPAPEPVVGAEFVPEPECTDDAGCRENQQCSEGSCVAREEEIPEEPAPVERRRTPIVSLLFDRTAIHRLGEEALDPDMYYSEITGNIWVNDEWAVVLGAMFTSFGMPIDFNDIETSIRSLSWNAIAGFEYASSGHRLQVLGFGGVRYIASDHFGVYDDPVSDNVELQGEFGGSVRWRYDPFFSVGITGSSNPFNPLSASIRGSIPRTNWTRDSYPSLGLDVMWLQSLATHEDGDGNEALQVAANDVLGRLTLRIPIYHIPMGSASLLPVAIAMADMNFHDGFDWADFSAGGALELEAGRLRLEVAGLASVQTGRPLVLASMTIR